MKPKQNGKSHDIVLIMVSTLMCIGITVLLCVLFATGVRNSAETVQSQKYGTYYALICEDRASSFWTSVYEGAQKTAEESGAYVELFGDNLSQEYSTQELLNMAIAAKVDGIILQADDSDEMLLSINDAAEAGIPVVTLHTDSPFSKRCSFVSIGSYNLGREYGAQIQQAVVDYSKSVGTTDFVYNVDVLIGNNGRNDDQNLICLGIQESLEQSRYAEQIVIHQIPIDDVSSFSVEESVRGLFVSASEELPNLIVCPSQIDTTCVYQAVVDYNCVGQVTILGYYDSDTILNAISRGVIRSTVSVDTEQMGRYCVEALTEYREFGYTSQFFTADLAFVDRNNVDDYLKAEDVYEE